MIPQPYALLSGTRQCRSDCSVAKAHRQLYISRQTDLINGLIGDALYILLATSSQRLIRAVGPTWLLQRNTVPKCIPRVSAPHKFPTYNTCGGITRSTQYILLRLHFPVLFSLNISQVLRNCCCPESCHPFRQT